MSVTPPPPAAPEPVDPAEPTGSVPEPVGGPLTDRWWWSGVLRTVVGVGVIAYQTPVLQDGTWLNGAMVVIGAAVAVWGLSVLMQDYRTHRTAQTPQQPGDDLPR
ncbi:MAG TPA: hypothetical protein VN257_09980 [Actinotalea sp.]|nr:hypothetical protein [Actinotalea sp.]